MSKSATARAATRGRLHPVFRGVYALRHARIGQRGRMFAAVLSCGKGAAVSHRSAAAPMGLLDKAPTVVDLIAPGQRGRGDRQEPEQVAEAVAQELARRPA